MATQPDLHARHRREDTCGGQGDSDREELRTDLNSLKSAFITMSEDIVMKAGRLLRRVRFFKVQIKSHRGHRLI